MKVIQASNTMKLWQWGRNTLACHNHNRLCIMRQSFPPLSPLLLPNSGHRRVDNYHDMYLGPIALSSETYFISQQENKYAEVKACREISVYVIMMATLHTASTFLWNVEENHFFKSISDRGPKGIAANFSVMVSGCHGAISGDDKKSMSVMVCSWCRRDCGKETLSQN